MSEQLLNILKLCLLALLYLFFLRVLRAVWTEVKGPVAVAPGPAVARQPRGRERRASAARQLQVVEPAAQKGRTFPLSSELTVGRAAGCEITLDDTFASQIHARVFARDGQYLLEDLGSTNGTYLNGQKVTGPAVFSPGDRMQIGNTVMELR